MRWKTTSAELLERLQDSGSTAPVPRAQWPAFGRRMPGVVGVWGWPTTGPLTVRSDGTTIHGVVGALDVLRRDESEPSSRQVKAYRYYLVELADGTVQRTGPFRDVDYGHWRADLPPWASTGS